MKKLKIALLAPLTRPPHPDTRGSRPRIVYDLANELVAKGHSVTTFASADAELAGKIIVIAPTSVYKMEKAENPFYQHMIYLCRMMDELIKRQGEFDIVHSHLYPEVLPITYAKFLKIPMVVTPHLYMYPELVENLANHPEVNFVMVSSDQAKHALGVNIKKIIYNGIAFEDFEFNSKPQDYLLFFGRIKEGDPKGVINAINVAEKLNANLKIAGNVESKVFYDREIAPHLNDKIQFVGPIDSFGPISFKEKIKLYKNAKAFLFPINFKEAFGMTMLEAMACGTPVIASRLAATSEAIVDGETGFLVEPGNIEQMVNAVKKIDQIDRKKCREYIEKNFSAQKMAAEYEKLYQEILEQK